MTIGDRIRKARNMRGLTQKELGVAIGISETTADVRMAQYETGTRVPKEKILFYIAKALDVSLEYLSAPSIVSISDVMITLMEQEIDHLNEVTFDETEYINQYGEPMKRTGVYFNRADLESSLAEWAKVKKELLNGDISLAEYDEWKTNWPATSSVHNDEPKQWRK